MNLLLFVVDDKYWLEHYNYFFHYFSLFLRQSSSAFNHFWNVIDFHVIRQIT